jgi:hypothetical protein
MIAKVRKIWITDFLQKSLSHEVHLLLGLKEQPDAVARPMDLLVQRSGRGERPLPPGTRVVDIYDDMDEALLILGEPGGGKTTLLLELCRDLLDRADDDTAHPIPVVFPLTTWSESRRPLAEWLAEELNLRYDVPRKLAQEWVNAEQVLPLLDGLDEVKAEHRAACVEAINAYRQEHGLLPLVVCSRTADYLALAVKARLHGAIVAQPLTTQQVESYLSEIGPNGTAVRRALREDQSLWDLLDTPLMLNIVVVAYAGQADAQPPMGGTFDERRDHLFGAYVDQMFRRRSVEHRYTPAQTVHWLGWLAHQMADHSQTIFYLERLQLDWFPQKQRRMILICYGLIVRLVSGLVFGLGFGLVFGMIGGMISGMIGGLVFGLVFGLLSGLLFGLGESSIVNIYVDTVHWSWTKSRENSYRWLVGGLVFGLGYGLVGGLGYGLGFGLAWMPTEGKLANNLA